MWKRKSTPALEKGAPKIIESMSRKKQKVNVEKLVELYDSDGITPDVLKKAGLDMEIPADFYNRITSRHMIHKGRKSRPFIRHQHSSRDETDLL